MEAEIASLLAASSDQAAEGEDDYFYLLNTFALYRLIWGLIFEKFFVNLNPCHRFKQVSYTKL
jgi:hypothetical protein